MLKTASYIFRQSRTMSTLPTKKLGKYVRSIFNSMQISSDS